MKHIYTLLTALLLGSTAIKAQTLVTFHTNEGIFVVEMTEEITPITSGNFIDLTNEDFFDGITFHRVIDNFVIQGGDPDGTGEGGPGYEIEDEFGEGLSNVKGTISMANSGPNTGGSQFFINLVNNTFLDHDVAPLTSAHPVFGRVVANFNIVDIIGDTDTDANDAPIMPMIMDSVRVRPKADENTGAIAYWSLNDETAIDLTDNYLNGLVYNVDDVEGANFASKAAMEFGGGAYVDFGDRYDELFTRSTPQLSISCWIKVNEWPESDLLAPIISKYATEDCEENQAQFYLSITDNGGLELKVNGATDGSQYMRYTTDADELELDEWMHLTVSYDASEDGEDRTAIYLNGESISIDAEIEGESFIQCPDTEAHLALGTFINQEGEPCDDHELEASIDELYLFNKILNEDEIEELGTLEYAVSTTKITNTKAEIYPNPITNNQLNIQLNNRQRVEIIITNLKGEILQKTNTNDEQISLSMEDYPAGIYQVQLIGKGINETHKIVLK